jgi:uncharacterized damage-inducible protein DinB
MTASARAPEIRLLLRIVDEAYERKAWHGPNLRGSIRGLTIQEAAWRPTAGRHNIWEIVVHAAYWKYIVLRRLRGGRKGAFPIRGSNWFVRPVIPTLPAWRADVASLEAMHRTMRAAIAQLTSIELRKIPSGSKVSTVALVSGIAAHDVYHAGQIQLLKRLARTGARPDTDSRPRI